MGLSVGEQGERGAVEEHGEHEQMCPRCRSPGQPGAGEGGGDEEGNGSGSQSGEGHVDPGHCS